MNPVYRNITDLDWITILLTISLVLLCVGKYFFKNSFFNFMILPFNDKYISLNKKRSKIFHGFHVIVSVFQIINMALLLFVAWNMVRKDPFGVYNEFYFVIAMGLIAFFVIKIMMQTANGYFFDNPGLMSELVFEKLTYFNYGGLIAFVGNILMIYVFPGSFPLLFVLVLLVFVVNAIGLVRILGNHQKLIAGNIFYFILYLCALEISPIAIIISYLNS